MPSFLPTDPVVLAGTVVTTLATHFDPQARGAAIAYWERESARRQEVADAVKRLPDDTVVSLVFALQADPSDPEVHHRLYDRLTEAARHRADPETETLFDLAWQVECVSRIGYHMGPGYRADGYADMTADALLALPRPEGADDAGAGAGTGASTEVLIVIPFQDRGPRRRLRNVLACLFALQDQSAPRSSYRVVLVESDEVPRHRAALAPLVDTYCFAPKSGLFNKSWAVNVGVVNAPGRPGILCVLDADVLVDRDFVARNVARFRTPGTMGHLSYRDMWCLDEAATSWAIEERLVRRADEADRDHLRAFLVRRPPGCCVWCRTSAFHRVHGMDERFEGWGGEDNDFLYRMDVYAALDHYDDPLLHMHHPSSGVLRDDGQVINAHIPALSWSPTTPIGDRLRFAGTVPGAGAAAGSGRGPAGSEAQPS